MPCPICDGRIRSGTCTDCEIGLPFDWRETFLLFFRLRRAREIWKLPQRYKRTCGLMSRFLSADKRRLLREVTDG